MAARPCGLEDCPIVDPDSIDRRLLRVVHWGNERSAVRVVNAKYARKAFTPAGVGQGRFSPLDDAGHLYFADQRSASVLESALHEADGPNPRIYRAQLARYVLSELRFQVPLRLIDLRDPALALLGVERGELTDVSARHYGCTRRVAQQLLGTKKTHGFVWTSRQGRMHAERNPDGLASEVLRHQNLDVAVIYSAGALARSGLVHLGAQTPLLERNEPVRFVAELANLLRIAIL